MNHKQSALGSLRERYCSIDRWDMIVCTDCAQLVTALLPRQSRNNFQLSSVIGRRNARGARPCARPETDRTALRARASWTWSAVRSKSLRMQHAETAQYDCNEGAKKGIKNTRFSARGQAARHGPYDIHTISILYGYRGGRADKKHPSFAPSLQS